MEQCVDSSIGFFRDVSNDNDFVRIPISKTDYDNHVSLMQCLWGPPKFEMFNTYSGCNFDKYVNKNFYRCCEEGQIELAKNVYTHNKYNGYTFVNCCEMNYMEMAKWIYSLGNFDLASYVCHAIEQSCKNGHFEIVKWLHGLESITNINYNKAFVVACENGQFEIANWMHELEPNTNFNYGEAFEAACVNGHIETAKWLHQFVTDINDCSRNAFQLACANGHIEIVQWLHSIGANIHFGNNWAFRISCRNGHLTLAKMLYQLGADIHVGNEDALRLACVNGHFEIVLWLYGLGADVSLAIKGNLNSFYRPRTRSVFSLICLNDHLNIAQWLCNSHVINDAIIEDAFEVICENSDKIETAKWLYSMINDPIKIGKSFAFACKHGHFEIARWLLSIDQMLIVDFLSPDVINNLCDGYMTPDVFIERCLKKLGYDKQKIITIKRIIDGKNLDQYCQSINDENVDDIILHIIARHNRINDLKQIKLNHTYISYDVLNDIITNFSIKRIRSKSARSFC